MHMHVVYIYIYKGVGGKAQLDHGNYEKRPGKNYVKMHQWIKGGKVAPEELNDCSVNKSMVAAQTKYNESTCRPYAPNKEF